MENVKDFKDFILGERGEQRDENNFHPSVKKIKELLTNAGINAEYGINYIVLDSKEDTMKVKELADAEGIYSHLSNRSPTKLFFNPPSEEKRKRERSAGNIAVNIIKLINDNPELKPIFDNLVDQKGGRVSDVYTPEYLDQLFSRIELKKYYKTLPNMESGKSDRSASASAENEKWSEFLSIYKKPDGTSYNHPFDYLADQHKAGNAICPIAKVMVKKQYLSKNEIINTFRANGNKDALEQLSACREF